MGNGIFTSSIDVWMSIESDCVCTRRDLEEDFINYFNSDPLCISYLKWFPLLTHVFLRNNLGRIY